MYAPAYHIAAGQQRFQLVEIAWSFCQPMEILGFGQGTKECDGVARRCRFSERLRIRDDGNEFMRTWPRNGPRQETFRQRPDGFGRGTVTGHLRSMGINKQIGINRDHLLANAFGVTGLHK